MNIGQAKVLKRALPRCQLLSALESHTDLELSKNHIARSLQKL